MPEVRITIPCRLCDKETDLIVDAEAFARWAKGASHVQLLFPNLSAADRELMISRTCGACWDKLFPPDPDMFRGDPVESEFGDQLEWSNLPSDVQATALNTSDEFRGCRWYRQDLDATSRAYLAFTGDPSRFVGSIQARRRP